MKDSSWQVGLSCLMRKMGITMPASQRRCKEPVSNAYRSAWHGACAQSMLLEDMIQERAWQCQSLTDSPCFILVSSVCIHLFILIFFLPSAFNEHSYVLNTMLSSPGFLSFNHHHHAHEVSHEESSFREVS